MENVLSYRKCLRTHTGPGGRQLLFPGCTRYPTRLSYTGSMNARQPQTVGTMVPLYPPGPCGWKMSRPQIHTRCLFRGGAEMSPNALAHALDDSTTGHLGGLPGTVGHFWFWAQFSDGKGIWLGGLWSTATALPTSSAQHLPPRSPEPATVTISPRPARCFLSVPGHGGAGLHFCRPPRGHCPRALGGTTVLE